MYTKTVLFIFVISLFIALAIRVRRLLLKICKAMKNFFMFLCIIIGERSYDRRSSDFQYKLYCFLIEVDLLDEAAVNDIHSFSKDHIESNYSVHDTHKYLLKQTYIALLRDCVTGTLRGYQVIKRVPKGSYTILHFGTTVISQQYQGHGISYAPIAYTLFKELILHPFTPLYFIFRSIGYKSYVAACHTCPESTYPRYNAKTPDNLKKIMEEYVESNLTGEEEYDKETSVLRKKGVALKLSHSSISEEDKKNPHIKFFADNNPGYASGHLLITLVIINWQNVFRAFKKGFLGSSKKRARAPMNVPSPTFGQKFSFIEKSTGKYFIPTYETDIVSDKSDCDDNDIENKLERNPYIYRKPSLFFTDQELFNNN